MTFSKNTLWAMLAAVILTTIACTKGDEKPESAYASGVFIICEGPFGSGTGTMSYYNRVDSTRGDIYGAANSGAAIGNILQSYTVHNDVGYLLANNANKIFESTFTSQIMEESAKRKSDCGSCFDSGKYFFSRKCLLALPERIVKYKLLS